MAEMSGFNMIDVQKMIGLHLISNFGQENHLNCRIVTFNAQERRIEIHRKFSLKQCVQKKE
jgi:hypothetical protein